MPIYEYLCTSCDDLVEVIQKMGDRPLRKCKKCSGKLAKRARPWHHFDNLPSFVRRRTQARHEPGPYDAGLATAAGADDNQKGGLPDSVLERVYQVISTEKVAGIGLRERTQTLVRVSLEGRSVRRRLHLGSVDRWILQEDLLLQSLQAP